MACGFLVLPLGAGGARPAAKDFEETYRRQVRPLLVKYCFTCHSTKARRGDLDLERFEELAAVRKDVGPWQHLIEQMEAGEMPPKGRAQPTPAERRAILDWVRSFLDAEARARSGDPGHVPLRRLSNAEYDCTIRDLTGVDLRPTREFPADGAAGEGFTNAAEALSDVTPALFTRYLGAAKSIADHAVLLPEGFRFSPRKTRRDWTDESLAHLREFYGRHTTDGRLNFRPYLLATLKHRQALEAGKITPAETAAREKLNPKYLEILWRTLHRTDLAEPLAGLSKRWHAATAKDVDALVDEVAAWQKALWKFVPVGSYRYGATTRQVGSDPAAAAVLPLRLEVKPDPGQDEVVVHLAARDLAGFPRDARVVWQRPRFEGSGPPLLLKDYAALARSNEVAHADLFADTPKYLAAAVALTEKGAPSLADLAAKTRLNAALLQRWQLVLGLEPAGVTKTAQVRPIPALPLTLLDEKTPKNGRFPAVNGWRRKGVELPIVVGNSSDAVLQVPGTMQPHSVAVHPTPQEFVAVVWESPMAGEVAVAARITHAHPACGNGVAWWLEHRRNDQAFLLAEGATGLGGAGQVPARTVTIEKGDRILLAIDARNADHVCDLTRVELSLTAPKSKDGKERMWDLAQDLADTLAASNPHGDRLGNKATWSFVRGPAKRTSPEPAGKQAFKIPPPSLLGQWRAGTADPKRRSELPTLADKVGKLLAGSRPADAKHPDRLVFDALVGFDGVLLRGLDLAPFARPRPGRFGLPAERFGKDGDLVVPAGETVEVRLPAALFRDRTFVVEARPEGNPSDRVVLFQATVGSSGRRPIWNGTSPLVADAKSAAFADVRRGFDAFRRLFPWYLCFPNVVPTDEVVSLKMFHREDEPLERLFLDEKEQRRLDHLWREHLFISRQPIAENDYLPQFIGFVTQDQPRQLLDYFLSQRPVFKKKAEVFAQEVEAAEPFHLKALGEFASRAYRRPLQEKEQAELQDLYRKLRKKDLPHEEAFRGVLARVLLAPAFLFRIEKAPPGPDPAPVDDWELASRLSYFLWSSLPDDELSRLAAAGKLRDPEVLAAQTRRMLRDQRLRALAIEFGTQWIHVRGFDSLKEKNEKLFPTFTPELRRAIYEESILFFQDLFRADRPVTNLLDADYTFLDEMLAKHYGIPGVQGPQWRRVEGVRKYGRGGLLGLASVHAKQSGASRTSPVLRGNWVVETLLGEKLPRPPANVPILPDVAGGTDNRTTRQMVEKHVSDPNCAACHVRIDPLGFAFENFDPIGRWRTQEAPGLPVDARAKLRDGTEFEGIDGLRTYLLSKKKDVVVRLFCRKLLGYALGRATTLSDTATIDRMVADLNRNEGRVEAAVLAVVASPQFRMIRGRDAAAK